MPVPPFEAVKISESRGADIAWRRMSAFQDIERASTRLMAEREIPRSQKDNVRKQMQQLAFSIEQAREFFRSALVSGPSTRALMAYYGVTSLANAEILWRGSGLDSLDARPEQYNAHGFSLVKSDGLLNYRARPAMKNQEITGLFGLWRTYAEHIPIYGESKVFNEESASTTSLRIMSGVVKLTEIEFPAVGLSLGDCLANLPAMQGSLRGTGYDPKLCRGRIDEALQKDQDGLLFGRRSYSFHHFPETLQNEIGERFAIDPRRYEEFQFDRVGNGLLVYWKIRQELHREERTALRSPEAYAKTANELFYVGDGEVLNEFGHYYLALYVAGMVTRYYPHLWVKEIRSSTTAAILIDELVEHALERVPVLVAGALERIIFLYD